MDTLVKRLQNEKMSHFKNIVEQPSPAAELMDSVISGWTHKNLLSPLSHLAKKKKMLWEINMYPYEKIRLLLNQLIWFKVMFKLNETFG